MSKNRKINVWRSCSPAVAGFFCLFLTILLLYAAPLEAAKDGRLSGKVIDLITSHADFTEVPFEPSKDETVAIDHAMGGHDEESEIPEAKYGGDAEELRGPAERS